VLKKTEIARFNEHRTARLAIAAYDHVLPNDRAGEPAWFRGANGGAEGGRGQQGCPNRCN
jgi:hypothetical protein